MKEIAQLLNDMVSSGVIADYALFGWPGSTTWLTPGGISGGTSTAGCVVTDIQDLLDRQSDWQRSLRNLSWPEKIRMAEALRSSILTLRGQRSAPTSAPSPGAKPSSETS